MAKKLTSKKLGPPPLTKREVQSRLIKKLASSGISADIGKQLGIEAKLEKEAMEMVERPAAGFKIPYFDLNGKPTSFWRFRFLEPQFLPGGKEIRYTQIKDSINEVYLPPLIDWAMVAKEVEIPILITEGELKAAAACAKEFACMALGGVWMFRSAKRGTNLLPQFKLINWQKRDVFIIYDSDAGKNPDVLRAEVVLAKELTTIGAKVHIVRLPDDDGAKVGLDDYLLERDADDLDGLLATAQDFKSCQALHEMNEEVVYVKDPGSVFDLASGRAMRPGDFTAHAYANRHHPEVTTDKDGETRLVMRSTAMAWLKWPGRAEVNRIVYKPGQPKFTKDSEINEWPGWAVEPKKGNIEPWKKLLDHLFEGQEGWERCWFERWLAYPLQHPGAKMHAAVLMWGRHFGTGKSQVGYTMGKIYGENFAEISEQEMFDGKNDWAARKQFILGDEVSSGAEDKKYVYDKLKAIITRQKIRIDIKFVPKYTLADCINYLMNSNYPDTFPMPEDDRRVFVWEVKCKPKDKDFYDTYIKWAGEGEKPGPGIPALFHHLLHLDLKGMGAADWAPQTQDKRNMAELTKTVIGAWVRRLLLDPTGVLKTVMGKSQPYRLWTTNDLLRVFDPLGGSRMSAQGMGRELIKAGVHKAADGANVKTPEGYVKVWDIFPTGKLSVKQAESLYAKERGLSL